jgi:ABC-type transport system substrate-binding protein
VSDCASEDTKGVIGNGVSGIEGDFLKPQRLVLSLVLLGLLIFGLSAFASPVAADTPPNLNVGPFVSNVAFNVMPNQDNRVLALLAGDIEFDYSFLDPVHLDTFESDPDISVFRATRNGYGHLTINCAKYPLNISGFRRAFAYAYNKTRFLDGVFGGITVAHDSVVPLPNGWCIEDDLEWHYYDARPDIGNTILDRLNFTIDPESGYRLAPDCTPFSITIEYIPGGIPAREARTLAAEAFDSLHVNATTMAADYNDLFARLGAHEDYDIVFYESTFQDFDVDWLAYEYWSEYADVPNQNPSNFRNETYDSWRNQLLYATTYEEVYEAASAMQQILHENVPRLVVFEQSYACAYRDDVYAGHILNPSTGVSNLWTLRKVHRVDGVSGGTVHVGLREEPDSFNIFVGTSAFSGIITENLWPSLLALGPENAPIPYLAEDLVIETHALNSSVPEGHIRFSMGIVQNATWSDGTPLTADDVAFTFTYYLESSLYGNPAAVSLGDLVGAIAPSPYRVVIEYGTETYWHLNDFAYTKIIPKHIFNDVDGIGYAGWEDWNPVFDSSEPHVTCGPFSLSGYIAGESYVLSANPYFSYFPGSDQTTSSDGSSGPGDGLLMTRMAIGMVSGVCVVFIVYTSAMVTQRRRRVQT